jgi:ubiquinone biosynthesis protein
MIWGTYGVARDLARLREISSVLIRHGLGDLVRRTGLATALERAGQILHWGEAGKSTEIEPQERFRRSLEELGPTFVKLGQVLSTRPDLLSPSWIAELERLHSEVAPVSFDELLPQIEKALGRLRRCTGRNCRAAYLSSSRSDVPAFPPRLQRT